MCKRKKKVYMHAFYNMKSELKFKGYELKLHQNNIHIILKDLRDGKEYTAHIMDTIQGDTDSFIKMVKGYSFNQGSF